MVGTHDPKAEWLYGLDVSVHPDYQGKGIGRENLQCSSGSGKTIGNLKVK